MPLPWLLVCNAQDVLVTPSGAGTASAAPPILFCNNGDGTFTDCTSGSGVDATGDALTNAALFVCVPVEVWGCHCLATGSSQHNHDLHPCAPPRFPHPLLLHAPLVLLALCGCLLSRLTPPVADWCLYMYHPRLTLTTTATWYADCERCDANEAYRHTLT